MLGTAPGTIALVVLGDAVTGRVAPALLAVSVTGGLVGTVGAVVAARRPHLDRAPSPDRRMSCRSTPQRSKAGIRRWISRRMSCRSTPQRSKAGIRRWIS